MILLSIIVPTKNRLNYLRDCIKSILLMDSDSYEVIIQDNSDNHEEVESFVEEISSPRIKYYYCGDRLSQTENSELALSHATGEFVCFIGDDDSVCESMLSLAQCMQKYKIDACTYNIPAYHWNDLVEKLDDKFYLAYKKPTGKITRLDPIKTLIKYMKNGMQDIGLMPRAYHGIVSRRLLEEIKKNAGCFFPGPSPDMANATACALFCQSYFHIDIPMIVSGYGKNSAGGMGQRHLHKGPIKGNFQLREDIEEIWDKKIPQLWMQNTIYPCSTVTAIKSCRKDQFLKYLNYGAIYISTLYYEPAAKSEIKAIKPTIKEKFHMLTYGVKKLFLRTVRKRDPLEKIYEKINLPEATQRMTALYPKDIKEVFSNYYEKHK